MYLSKLWVIALRDLGRNRRRTVISLTAIALGLALLIVLSGYISGTIEGALQNSIRLKTGHVQLRAESYEEEKMSLLWSELLQDPQILVSRAAGMQAVKAATPVLWAGGILSTLQESVGLQVNGIDTLSPIYNPIREGMVEGEFPNPDERGQIIIGMKLAKDLGIGVGSRVSLIVGQSEGDPREGIFTVRGIFNTGVPAYDQSTVFMPLSQAQAISGTGERASAIVIQLYQQEDAAAVAKALETPGINTLTWEDMHAFLLVTLQSVMGFYYLMYGIVMLVVAVIITNTLLMGVFERTQEIGILAALGMKKRQIMSMILLEASVLALAGILFGIILGSAIVAYLSVTGIHIGESIAGVAGADLALGTTLYTNFVPGEVFGLSFALLAIILLASLYPARFASRLEPVKALHSI